MAVAQHWRGACIAQQYANLVHFLASIRFDRIELDHYSVFVHHSNGLIIAIYVDGLLLMGPDSLENGSHKDQLGEKFRMNDLGPLSW